MSIMSEQNLEPAFPTSYEYIELINPGHPNPLQQWEKARILRGMSLHDYYVGCAIEYVGRLQVENLRQGGSVQTPKEFVDMAFEVANTIMLKRDQVRAEGSGL